jgi:putative PIN family toxin of toxin-antitoxin system
MRITLDTNVLYQALRDSAGASHYIVQLLRERNLDLALSIPVFLEYRAVLTRPKTLIDIRWKEEEIEAFLRFIAYIGKPITIHYLMRPNLTDEDDNMFVDLAFASNSRFLITSNLADFTQQTELKFDSFEVVTPAQFVRWWRKRYE